MGDTLHKGETLGPGHALTSGNGAYRLLLQNDGNLVLHCGDTAVWSTETRGRNVVRAEMQADGNFVLYTPDKPVWHSDTKGAKDVRLILQDDRNLVLYSRDGVAWASGTDTDEAPPPATDAELTPVVAAAPRTYTVVSGDTLWALAERFYSDGNRYQRIADANGIDSDVVHPGQVLTIP